MKELKLQCMTRELCHELFKEWTNDEAIFMDMSSFKTYVYDESAVNRYFDSKQNSSIMLFAIMLANKPIGEVQLKQIDYDKKECTLSIHMQNDAFKGKGYGTKAEQLAIEYAFGELGMNAVNADSVKKNVRSQHVMEKVGFKLVQEDNDFRYYRIKK